MGIPIGVAEVGSAALYAAPRARRRLASHARSQTMECRAYGRPARGCHHGIAPQAILTQRPRAGLTMLPAGERTTDFRVYDSVTMLAVTQVPQLASRFPVDAVTSNEEGNTVYPIFSFSDHKLLRHGRARISGTTEWYQHIVPPEEWLRFPITFNAQRTTANTVVVDTAYVNGLPTKTSADTGALTAYVDGYGTLLLPGGLTLKCLRLRLVASHPKTAKAFQYWTREGTVVLIDSDQSQPDTGVIKRGYVIYYFPQAADRNTRR